MTDDRYAGAVDAERGHVHSQNGWVVAEFPRLEREQCAAGLEQCIYRFDRHLTVRQETRFEVTVFFRHQIEQVLEDLVELRSRSDGDRYVPPDLGAHLGRGWGIGDTDSVGPSRPPGRGLLQGVAECTREGALGFLRPEDIPSHNEAVGQFEPEREAGPVGLGAIVDEEGRHDAAADPLVGGWRVRVGAAPLRSDASAPSAVSPPSCSR